MNLSLLCKSLGIVALLIGGSMLFSLPWAIPHWAQRSGIAETQTWSFERTGAISLLASIAVCCIVGGLLSWFGRRAGGQLFRKEAMAVVGFSWVLATLLGALPYYFAGIETHPGQEITFIEAMFEAQSGFSTTGATVLTDLENPQMVPHCLLFWRSSTHFLGGLGIVVLFVAILGQGSAGKAMMRAEMPGPTKEGSMPRMQHTALMFAAIYIISNLLLCAIYMLEGMTAFDALCHAFATMATGGFSTYNASLGHFDSAVIEYTTILFMILAGTNFTLLYLSIFVDPRRLFSDVEFRVYLGVIVTVTCLVVYFGHVEYSDPKFETLASSVRFGLFQVVSILTTTGYGTADFDTWNNFGRGILLLLMFIGGCAGSTGGGLKIIRHILFYKVLRLEVEHAHHPRVVRPLRLGGQAAADPDLPRAILVYFGLILGLFVFSWLLLITFEPDQAWGVVRSTSGEASIVATESAEPVPLTASGAAGEAERIAETLDEKLLDCASAVAATLNNIGPGLGVVGTTRNYAGFSQGAKLLFVWLMMLGRVEVYSILVLLSPFFWRRY